MLVKTFPLVVVAIFVSWCILDTWIALAAMKILNSSAFLQTITSNIPDILFAFVCSISILFWSRYLMLKLHGVISEETKFCKIAGIAVPVAFILKSAFKSAFGRLDTRIWIANQFLGNFHWFRGGGDYSSFPSGHMTVFTALFSAIWLFYPRYRSISIGLALSLGLTLMVTDYHFLSDVIAGAYLGLITTVLTLFSFEKLKLLV